MKELNLSLVSYYTVCRYNSTYPHRILNDQVLYLWELIAENVGGHPGTIDMICDWIMQCCYNG